MAKQRKNKKPVPWHETLLKLLLGNLKATLAGVSVLVVALVGLSARGCGGGESQSSSAPATPKTLKAVTATLTMKPSSNAQAEPPWPKPSPQNEASQHLSSPNTRAAEPESTVKPEEAGRPRDVADWKGNDYEGAARDGDPQLVGALAYFGPHFAGKESAANFLAKLLKASEAASLADNTAPLMSPFRLGGNSSYGKRKSPPTEAIMAALVVNGTPRAWQILESIVDGSLTMADQQAVAVSALKSLATHPGPETEDLLFRLVTAPEAAAGDPATNKTAKLRNMAMELIRTGKFASLSVRLAKWLLATETSKALHDQVWACLKEPRPENLPAQILLYQSDLPDQAMHDWLEQWIVACSSSALGRLLRIPALPAAPARSTLARGGATAWSIGVSASQRLDVTPAKNVVATDPYPLAERLWQADLAAVIEERLRALETLDKGTSLLALASTAPNPSVRSALLRTLDRHWEEGPKQLKVLCTTEDVNVEPGFVALVKMLRRSDGEPAGSNDKLAHNGNHHRSTTQATKKLTDARETNRRQEQMGRQWMEFSRDIAQALCRRLYAAARAKPSGRGGVDRTADDPDLPWKLPPHVEVAAVYRLDWPEGLSGKIAAPPLLRVRYVRLEQKAAPVKVLAYYRRQVPTSKEHALAGSDWLDSIVIDKEQLRARSVDVFVAKAGQSDLGPANQEQELTVDVLTIECEGAAKPCPISASR